MGHQPQPTPDGSRLAAESDRARKALGRRVDGLESRIEAIESYLADDLFTYLTSLAPLIPFVGPPRPPWA